MGRMQITQQITVFDAPDLPAESGFWAAVLGGTVDADDDWHTLRVGGRPVLGFQLAPNLIPPDWPDGTPQQMHLDLYVDDITASHAEVVGLGARVLQTADTSAAHGFQVYADPAGHPFCLCWG
jgi:predicted enzyme related to lactoylglutathione lyase